MEHSSRQKLAAYISIAIIVTFWTSKIRFIFAVADRSVLTLPETFLRVMIMNSIAILVIASLTRLEGESYAGMGFSRKRIGKQLLVGVLLGPAILLFSQVIVGPIVRALVPGPDPITITEWFQALKYIPMFFVMAIYGGGIGEELRRVFVLTRFEKLWGRPGLAIALVAHAVAFGAAHLYQGTQVAIGIGISNLAVSLVFLRRRSAIEMITAHATFDFIGITLGYLILYKG